MAGCEQVQLRARHGDRAGPAPPLAGCFFVGLQPVLAARARVRRACSVHEGVQEARQPPGAELGPCRHARRRTCKAGGAGRRTSKRGTASAALGTEAEGEEELAPDTRFFRFPNENGKCKGKHAFQVCSRNGYGCHLSTRHAAHRPRPALPSAMARSLALALALPCCPRALRPALSLRLAHHVARVMPSSSSSPMASSRGHPS